METDFLIFSREKMFGLIGCQEFFHIFAAKYTLTECKIHLIANVVRASNLGLQLNCTQNDPLILDYT